MTLNRRELLGMIAASPLTGLRAGIEAPPPAPTVAPETANGIIAEVSIRSGDEVLWSQLARFEFTKGGLSNAECIVFPYATRPLMVDNFVFTGGPLRCRGNFEYADVYSLQPGDRVIFEPGSITINID